MPSWSAVPKAVRARFPSPPERANFSTLEEFEETLEYWRSHIGRVVAFAMEAHRESPRRLTYRLVSHNGGLVFSEPDRAHEVAQLHVALRDSATWGDFRSSVSEVDYTDIVNSAFVERNEPPPSASAHFNAEQVPGWTNVDYPAWLQQDLDSVLPREILAEFAERRQTAVNSTYWHIPEEKTDAISKALVARGFTLEYKPNLPFH